MERHDTPKKKKTMFFSDEIWDQHELQTTAKLILANKEPGPAVLLRCLAHGCTAEVTG